MPRRRRRLVEHKSGIDRAVVGDRDGCGAQRRDFSLQPRQRRRVGEIALGQDDAVGERHLPSRLRHPLDVAGAVDRIDDGDERLQMKFAAERAVGGKSLQHRPRVGQARSLDDHPREARHRTAGAVGEQGAQGLLQIGAHVAAQAAIAEQDRDVAARPQQRLVDADLAELVDDDRGVGPFGAGEERPDQRRLAGAEKAGHRDDRQARPARAALAPAERRGVRPGKERRRPPL